jgi:hypothetical protein
VTDARIMAHPVPRAIDDVADYYAHAAVRDRLVEYCGGVAGAAPTAAYVAALRDDQRPHLTWERSVSIPAGQMATLFTEPGDLSRSLWDTASLLFVLDVDYQNVDVPQEPFTHPAEAFFKLEPVYRATRQVLARYGLPALDLMTGRGYHFTGRIPLDHAVVDQLVELVPEPPAWFATCHQRQPAGLAPPMTVRQARGSAGLGLLLEHLAHLVLRRAAGSSAIPVVVNGTVVGHVGAAGRECVSLDFSHVGDPLDTRHARLAFGTYQWHRFRPDIFGRAAAAFPPLVALPRRHRGLVGMLARGRGLDTAVREARRSTAVLPSLEAGIGRLLAGYASSPLAAFHREFHDGLRAAPDAVRSLDPASLPPCIAACLIKPNDLLLRPEHVQYLTRALLARDWQASDIAALVRAGYEADHEWGDRWSRMHARTRAEFDVRVFAGLVATGLDRLVDYNCVSAQEKGVCPGTGCAFDLRQDRDRLRSRGRI